MTQILLIKFLHLTNRKIFFLLLSTKLFDFPLKINWTGFEFYFQKLFQSSELYLVCFREEFLNFQKQNVLHDEINTLVDFFGIRLARTIFSALGPLLDGYRYTSPNIQNIRFRIDPAHHIYMKNIYMKTVIFKLLREYA